MFFCVILSTVGHCIKVIQFTQFLGPAPDGDVFVCVSIGVLFSEGAPFTLLSRKTWRRTTVAGSTTHTHLCSPVFTGVTGVIICFACAGLVAGGFRGRKL